ncbi:MAG: hypothetical protein HQL69_16345 [Magnetococcales bacterium]|nr:hypothetical protein [Magnetococcales bacterium]
MAQHIEKDLNFEKQNLKHKPIIWGFIFLATLLLFHKDWNIKIERSINPYVINSDTRVVISPYYLADNPELAQDTILAYIRSGHPLGFKLLYSITDHIISPAALGKLISICMFFATLFFLTAAAGRLEGYSAAWSVFIIFLSASFFYEIIAGGLPRSFAFPIMAANLAALVFGRTLIISFLTILGALFYPMSGLIAGATLFALLFLMPKADRGDATEWPLSKRVKIVAVVAALSCLLLLPTMIGKDYGRTLDNNDHKEYPEILGRAGIEPGQIGAYQSEIVPLWKQLIFHGRSSVRLSYQSEPWSKTLHGLGTYRFRFHYDKYFYEGFIRDDFLVIILWAAIFVVVGIKAFNNKNAPIRRVAMMAGVACSWYYLAYFMFPYLYFPARYLQPLIFIFLILLPVVASGLFDGIKKIIPSKRHQLFRSGFIIAMGLFCILFFGAKTHKEWLGYDKDYSKSAAYFKHINSLPKDSMIAAWPKGVIEAVPILSQRKAFVWHESHVAFHDKYILKMRERTFALIDAYFADSLEPLLKLRDSFGVTHLSIYKAHFNGKPAWYFAPFLKYAQQKQKAGGKRGFEVLRQIPNAKIFESEDIVTLDLSRLSSL